MTGEAGARRRWPLRALLVMLACAAAPLHAADAPAGRGVEVRIEGVDADLAKALAGELGIATATGVASDERYLRLLHTRALSELRDALRARGYYRPRIEGALERHGGRWVARYTIDPGPQVVVEALAVEIEAAAPDPDLERLRQAFPLAVGQRFDVSAWTRGKAELVSALVRRGYFDARISEHRVVVDPQRLTARVTLRVDAGTRYRVGALRLPPAPLAPGLLERLVGIEPGAPYDAARLARARQRLIDSDYFRSVELTPQPDPLRHVVDIDVSLTPRKRHRLRAGLGFGTDTGPRGTLSWTDRYVNAHGHQLGAVLRASPVQSTLSGHYDWPLFGPHAGALSFTGSLVHEDTDTSRSDSGSLGVRHAMSRGRWQEVHSIDYRFERFDVGGDTETTGLLVPGVGWTRSTADDPLFPTRGWRLAFDIRGAVEGVGSELSFLQGVADARGVRPVTTGTRLIGRLRLGATAVSDFGSLPSRLRFFAGGDSSIRGFDLQTLGPRDAAGEVVGGRFLAVGSVELARDVHGPWGVAAFADFGNAFDAGEFDPELGTGVGLRWRSPVGPIRLDVAVGASDPGLPVRLHLIIGPPL